MFKLKFLCALILSSILGCASITGVAVNPRSANPITPADIEDMFVKAKNVGENAIFIHDWNVPLETINNEVYVARTYKMKVALGLNVTTLENRSQVIAPQGFKADFTDAKTANKYIEVCKNIAKSVKPEYFCLATEVNFFVANSEQFLAYVDVYKKAYDAVKLASPSTKVCLSFNIELMQMHWTMNQKEKINYNQAIIGIFAKKFDVIALTTYPSPHFQTPAHLPSDYYTRLKSEFGGSKVIFMEVGWPTSSTGTLAEQKDFISRFPNLVSGLDVEMVGWSLLHDVSFLPPDLGTTGLFYSSGKAKH